MKKYNILLILFLLIISGCASSVEISETVSNEPSGFLHGLLHGFILLFSFIGSLFNDDIAVYAVNNNGALYDLGFLLGVFLFFGDIIHNSDD